MATNHDPGTEGYQAQDEAPSDAGTQGYQDSEGTAADPGTGRYQAEPFWSERGFSSFEHFLDAIEEGQDKMWGRPVRPLPDDLERVRSTDRDGAHRQLNLKVPPADHELLRELARSYSGSPTTMARMLVIRGVRRLSEQA